MKSRKKKVTKRRVKFVVWLNNFTDRRDDEWVVVWARERQEAIDRACDENLFDKRRFALARVLTAKEFRSEVGFTAR